MALTRHSLAWIEMQNILTKLLYRFDLEWINKDMNWHRDSRMYTLWEKPELMVRLTKNPNYA